MRITVEIKDLRITEIMDNMRRVLQVVHGYSRRAERVAGFTGPQLWAMRAIAEYAPIRVSDLAWRMYLQPPTVVGILDRLEQQGQVARTRSAEDRRVVTVTLTAKGKETVGKVPEVAQGVLLTGLKRLHRDQLAVVSEGLEIMVGLLGADSVPPQLLFSKEVNASAPRPRRPRKQPLRTL